MTAQMRAPVRPQHEALADSLIHNERVSFNCSHIAALTGYHPHVDLGQIFAAYVYQGDAKLLREIDQKALGITLKTIDETVQNLVESLSDSHRQRLERVDSATLDATALNSNSKTHATIREVVEVLQSEEVQTQLSARDLALVEQELLNKVRKAYGVQCEKTALDRYEQVTGYTVKERNEVLYIMEVPMLEDAEMEDAEADAATALGAVGSAFSSRQNSSGAALTSAERKESESAPLEMQSRDTPTTVCEASVSRQSNCEEAMTTVQRRTTGEVSCSSDINVADFIVAGSNASLESRMNWLPPGPPISSTCVTVSAVAATTEAKKQSPKPMKLRAFFPSSKQQVISRSNSTTEKLAEQPQAMPEKKSLEVPMVDCVSPPVEKPPIFSVLDQFKFSPSTQSIPFGEKSLTLLPHPPIASLAAVAADPTSPATATVATSLQSQLQPQAWPQFLNGKPLVVSPSRAAKGSRKNGFFANGKSKKAKKQKIAFSLMGRVDGISEQLDNSSDDPSDWKPIRVVVEMKNRVLKVLEPPPLYDQIQLVSYLIMTGNSFGDLVQSITETDLLSDPQSNPQPAQQSAAAVPSSSSGGGSRPVGGAEQSPQRVGDEAGNLSEALSAVLGASTPDALQSILTGSSQPTLSGHTPRSQCSQNKPERNFLFTRVHLNKPPYYHQHHWVSTIIPRLHIARDAIIAIRKDHELRRWFLQASGEQRRELIAELCPFLLQQR